MVKIELRGAQWTWTKNNMHSMSVSGAERGRGELAKSGDITLIHNTCLESLCRAQHPGWVGDVTTGPEVVFKNPGGLPELAHKET